MQASIVLLTNRNSHTGFRLVYFAVLKCTLMLMTRCISILTLQRCTIRYSSESKNCHYLFKTMTNVCRFSKFIVFTLMFSKKIGTKFVPYFPSHLTCFVHYLAEYKRLKLAKF